MPCGSKLIYDNVARTTATSKSEGRLKVDNGKGRMSKKNKRKIINKVISNY